MGHGIDVCLADPSKAESLEECMESEFVACLIRHAGLVIVGLRPAALFGFSPRCWRETSDARQTRRLSNQLFWTYAQLFDEYGIRLTWLARRANGQTMLAWRPAAVAEILEDEASRAFLREQGLPMQNTEELMSAMIGRLRAYYAGQGGQNYRGSRCGQISQAGRASQISQPTQAVQHDFPHEVGLVLGYPLEDVRGFMADGGRGAVVTGRWKVYGDVESACRRFDELERAECRLKQLYAEGTPMREFLRMGNGMAVSRTCEA